MAHLGVPALGRSSGVDQPRDAGHAGGRREPFDSEQGRLAAGLGCDGKSDSFIHSLNMPETDLRLKVRPK